MPDVAPVEPSQAAEWLLTGKVEMSVFQTLSAGKTVQLVDGGAAAFAWTTASWLRTSTAADKRGNRAMTVDTTIQ